MLHATIARAVIQMESMQVVVEQGDRIGVDYPAKSEAAKRIPETKAIRRALSLLKTALHQFSVCPEFEEDKKTYTLEVDEARILLFKKD